VSDPYAEEVVQLGFFNHLDDVWGCLRWAWIVGVRRGSQGCRRLLRLATLDRVAEEPTG